MQTDIEDNKTPAMHRDIFRLQLTNNGRLIDSPPWQNAIYFGYNVKSSVIACWYKWDRIFFEHPPPS